MAHFARIEDGLVTQVIVVDDVDCGDLAFPESEPVGQAFICGPHPEGLALPGLWLQTDISSSFRGCFAGIGYTFDNVADVFVPPPTPEELAP